MTGNPKRLAEQAARTVLRKTLRVRPGDNVIVETWSGTLPWATTYIAELRRLGAHPMLLVEDEETFWRSLEDGQGKQTGRVGDHEWAALAKADAYVFFSGPGQWPRFDRLSPKKMAGVAAYNGDWYQRAAKARLRGARIYLGRTSELAAKRWQLDLDRWRDELLRATLVPPESMHRLGMRIGARLRRGKVVTVRHPNGTDLRFRLGGYPVQLDDALVDDGDLKVGNNMASIPGGVVGVAIDHLSAHGEVRSNHRTYPDSGPVDGTRWRFDGGHLVEQSYASGGRPILQDYAASPKKGRDRLGYFSIGLNPKLTKSPQMEDQELGAVLLSLGGNMFRGGKNSSPFVVWTVVKGADVEVDGRPLLKAGRIVA